MSPCLGKHTYHPESGWCVRCGLARNDGRSTTPGGRVLASGTQPTTTPASILNELVVLA